MWHIRGLKHWKYTQAIGTFQDICWLMEGSPLSVTQDYHRYSGSQMWGKYHVQIGFEREMWSVVASLEFQLVTYSFFISFPM